jgi:hypothetical protein
LLRRHRAPVRPCRAPVPRRRHRRDRREASPLPSPGPAEAWGGTWEEREQARGVEGGGHGGRRKGNAAQRGREVAANRKQPRLGLVRLGRCFCVDASSWFRVQWVHCLDSLVMLHVHARVQ